MGGQPLNTKEVARMTGEGLAATAHGQDAAWSVIQRGLAAADRASREEVRDVYDGLARDERAVVSIDAKLADLAPVERSRPSGPSRGRQPPETAEE